MTARDFLQHRFAALLRRDYASVYHSYHADAPFRRQFPDRASYLQFARGQLAAIELRSWRSLRSRQPHPGQEEHILHLELSVDSVAQPFYELALLIETPQGWRYHSAQKLGPEDFTGAPEQLDFSHFDHAPQKIRF